MEERTLHARNNPIEKWSIESLRGKTLDDLHRWTEGGNTPVQRQSTMSRLRSTHRSVYTKLSLPSFTTVVASLNILSAPDGWQRRCWDLLIVVLVLVLCVTIPFEINVGFFYPDKSYKVWLYVMDAIFWLDMPVNMFGAFYEGTELVTDPHEIMEHYLWGNPFTENKGWFWIDLTGNIPWEYIFINSLGSGARKSTKLFKLLKLPKLLRIGKLMKYMGQYVTFAMFIQVS